MDWIFQAEHYFHFYNIDYPQRMDLVGFFMVGEALSWSKWMYGNHQLSTWDAFAHSLELRFGPSSYENHQATLFKLCQVGSVVEYQAAFKKLSN